MFLDGQLQLSKAQAVTADAASTNVLDLGVPANIGDGEPMALVLIADVAADITTGDETYAVKLQMDTADTFGSPTDIMSRTFTAAELAAGKRHVLPLPVGVEYEQYLRAYYDVGGTTPSVTLTAYIMPLSMVDKYRTYKDNSTIS